MKVGITRVFQEITLENRLGVELNNLEVDCISFYVEGKYSAKNYLREESCTLTFDKRESKNISIEPVKDYLRHWTNGRSSGYSVPEIKLQGIQVFVRRTDSTGQIQERVFEDGRIPSQRERPSYQRK